MGEAGGGMSGTVLGLFLGLVAVLVGVPGVAQENEAPYPGRSVSRADPPVVVATAERDLNADGRADTLRIELVEGNVHDDSGDGWCGALPKAEGRFTVVVRLAGRAEVATDLNRLLSPGPPWDPEGTGESLWFPPESWQIVFADYNGDGVADFNLGQYSNCNGWSYYLLSVAADGRLRRLLPVGISCGNDGPSTDAFQFEADGFWCGWYSNISGSGHVNRYRWGPVRGELHHVPEDSFLIEDDSRLGVCRLEVEPLEGEDRALRCIDVQRDCEDWPEVRTLPGRQRVVAYACNGTVLGEGTVDPEEKNYLNVGLQGRGALVVGNRLDRDICVTPPRLSNQPNPPTVRMPPGMRFAFYLPGATYKDVKTTYTEIKATDCAGGVVATLATLELHDFATWDVPEPAAREIQTVHPWGGVAIPAGPW